MKLLTPIADPAVSEKCLPRPVGADGELELPRECLVEDQQVDLVDAELAGALVEGVQGLVVAVVGDPDLGLDEDLRAVETRATDRFADLALVAVRRGGVDVAVTGRQRGLDRCDRLVRSLLEDTEPQGLHLDALLRLTIGVVMGPTLGAGQRRNGRSCQDGHCQCHAVAPT
jgi:hypothetical protein